MLAATTAPLRGVANGKRSKLNEDQSRLLPRERSSRSSWRPCLTLCLTVSVGRPTMTAISRGEWPSRNRSRMVWR